MKKIMKKEKRWIVIQVNTRSSSLFDGQFSKRRDAILDSVKSTGLKWKELRSYGYRCIKADIIYEVPKM